jgi:hypothetical protein
MQLDFLNVRIASVSLPITISYGTRLKTSVQLVIFTNVLYNSTRCMSGSFIWSAVTSRFKRYCNTFLTNPINSIINNTKLSRGCRPLPMTTVILLQYEGQLLWKPVRKFYWDNRRVKLALKRGDIKSLGVLLVTVWKSVACRVFLT